LDEIGIEASACARLSSLHLLQYCYLVPYLTNSCHLVEMSCGIVLH